MKFSNPPVSKMFPASYVCQGFEVKSEGVLGVGPAFRIAIPASHANHANVYLLKIDMLS